MSAAGRLLNAIAGLQNYITHDIDPDTCAACPRWDELQGAAVDLIAERDALRAELHSAANYIDVLGGDSKKYRIAIDAARGKA